MCESLSKLVGESQNTIWNQSKKKNTSWVHFFTALLNSIKCVVSLVENKHLSAANDIFRLLSVSWSQINDLIKSAHGDKVTALLHCPHSYLQAQPNCYQLHLRTLYLSFELLLLTVCWFGLPDSLKYKMTFLLLMHTKYCYCWRV